MDERVIKFRVGVMVLSTLFIAGILVLLFGDTGTLTRDKYIIYIHFADAPGVSEGTPIRKSGILIGRVRNVRFAEQGGVVVEAEIFNNVKVFRSEVPQVSGSLLGGDVVIQFVRQANGMPVEPHTTPPAPPGNTVSSTLTAQADAPSKSKGPNALPPGPDQAIQPGEFMEGTVAPNAFQVFTDMQGELSQAITALSNAGEQVSKLAGNINSLLEDNDQQINSIVRKTDAALDTFQSALSNINDVIADPKVRDNLKQMIDTLPDLLSESRNTVTSMRTTVESVDRNLRNLEGLTGPLGERGEQIVGRVDQAVSRLDDLLGILSDFGRKLNSGQGTIGKLMSDDELYNSLTAAVRNVECVTRELKPIIADARVFSDRIARNPEILGVRGAIQKSPGTKWPTGGASTGAGGGGFGGLGLGNSP